MHIIAVAVVTGLSLGVTIMLFGKPASSGSEWDKAVCDAFLNGDFEQLLSCFYHILPVFNVYKLGFFKTLVDNNKMVSDLDYVCFSLVLGRTGNKRDGLHGRGRTC